MLPRKIALEIIMTGDPISAERAAEFGLVNELCEPGQALERARALADRIAANAPLAVRESRKIALETVDAPDEEGLEAIRRGDDEARLDRGLRKARRPSSRSAPPEWKGR